MATGDDLTITYIGGPTALLEWGALRLLTDPTFDPPGGTYGSPPATLTKTQGPALPPETLGRIDAVLLSHDHHADNLDHAGRVLLAHAGLIVTTVVGAERLGGGAVGLAPWQTVSLPGADGRVLDITGTPARHGPPHRDRGPVTGFVLAFRDAPERGVYVAGDTVWYEGVAEVAQRFAIAAVLLNLGAARVAAVGPDPLTMTAEDGVQAAHAFPTATLVPLHFEGWAHFSESRAVIAQAFEQAGLAARVVWPAPGVPQTLPLPARPE